MEPRPVTTLLMVMIALVLALPARAWQNVEPTFRSARAELKFSATRARADPALGIGIL
jgi:hypothetical protein